MDNIREVFEVTNESGNTRMKVELFDANKNGPNQTHKREQKVRITASAQGKEDSLILSGEAAHMFGKFCRKIEIEPRD